ncbi:MAG TPA: transposase [Candidatus Tectomicrobia bacterium]
MRLAEVGTDMRKCPTGKHVCSGLGLAPHHDISGGSGLRSRPLTVVNRATQALRQTAHAVARSDAACGTSFRAMRARPGPQQARVATAHKIARAVSHLLKHHEAFTAESTAAPTRQRRARELKHLARRARTLGYPLPPVVASQPTGVV